MNTFWQYLALGLFCVMVFSPAWFFSKVTNYLFKEEQPDYLTTVDFVSPLSIVPNIDDEPRMDLDVKRLAAVTRAHESATSPEMKRIWMNKRLELQRQIRWRSLQIETKSGF